MGNWTVLGSATFNMDVPGAKSEADAVMSVLSKLMDLNGMKIDVQEIFAKEDD